LTQQTVCPTLALAFSGLNLMSAILIVTASLGQLPLDAGCSPPSPPPHEASARARARISSVRISRAFNQP
jgi:hypothetical protein